MLTAWLDEVPPITTLTASSPALSAVKNNPSPAACCGHVCPSVSLTEGETLPVMPAVP